MEYSDTSGAFLRSSSWLNPAGSQAVVTAAVQAATNANVVFSTVQFPLVGATTPGTGLYPSVQDGLLITYQTIPGTQFQFFLPAPLATLFLPGGILVNPTDPTWVALEVALHANLTDIAGNTVTGLVSAVKSSRRLEQVS